MINLYVYNTFVVRLYFRLTSFDQHYTSNLLKQEYKFELTLTFKNIYKLMPLQLNLTKNSWKIFEISYTIFLIN